MHVDVYNNPVDHEAFEMYKKNISAMNPDFEGVDDIFHEYFMRTKAYFDSDQQDIFQNGYDYDHKFEKVEVNAANAIDYVRGLNPRADVPDYSNVQSESTYVTGVPDWVFEELRDNLFMTDAPKSKSSKDEQKANQSDEPVNEINNGDEPETQVNVNKNRPHAKGQRADAISEEDLMQSINEAADDPSFEDDDPDEPDLASAFDDDDADVSDLTGDNVEETGEPDQPVETETVKEDQSVNKSSEKPQASSNDSSRTPKVSKPAKKGKEEKSNQQSPKVETQKEPIEQIRSKSPASESQSVQTSAPKAKAVKTSDSQEKVEVVNPDDAEYKLPKDETELETDDDDINDLFD